MSKNIPLRHTPWRDLQRRILLLVLIALSSLGTWLLTPAASAAGEDHGAPGSAAPPQGPGALPAFPGAQGAGATTPGGRGGTVYKVTQLDDYGENEVPLPGTLRHAIEQEGPRTVVFAVGGTLRLRRPLLVNHPYLTVAGNTAPFPGITVAGYETNVRADHVVLRYLRFRLDVEVMRERFQQGLDSGWDSVNASQCEYVVFDHLSGSHSVDETISFSGEVDQVTLSHSIIGYSLRSIFHDYGFERGFDHPSALHHNLGGLIAYLGRHDRHAVASSFYNVWANHNRRMPGMSAGRDDPENLMSYIDIRNSVMYNWSTNAAGIEAGSVERSRYHVNLVGNYFKPGPNTPEARRYAGLTVMGHNRAHLEGNVQDDDAAAGRPTPRKKLLVDRGRFQGNGDRLLGEPLPTPPVVTMLPPTLEAIANDTVGSSLPCRDSVDALVIQDVYEGTGYHPYADMEKDDSPPVPELPTIRHIYASADDPFPVWWKLNQGLAADTRIEPLADYDGDGYTNIEAYMYGLRLDEEPVDWSKRENIHNPLERTDTFAWAPPPDTEALPEGWGNRAQGETVYSHPDGVVVMAGSVAAGGSHGCRFVVQSDGHWTPGEGQAATDGPDGARSDLGPALVLAFPMPQTLKGIRIAKPRPDAYAAEHDPVRVVVQGLRGWPLYWVDLAEVAAMPALTGTHTAHVIDIPPSRRKAFSAYRIVFLDTRGKTIRIQSLSPIPDRG